MKDITLGKLVVKKVFESEGAMPMSMVLPGVDAEDLKKLSSWFEDEGLSEDPNIAAFKLSIHSYLLHIDGKKVLIDTCNGNNKKRSVDFANDLNTDYLDKLSSFGVAPDDVDIVMCTHLHCDHVGWNTCLDNGQWVPTFPNARYVFSREDYEFFIEQTHEALHREAFDDSVLPVVKAGKAEFIETGTVVLGEKDKGLWVELAKGHSPGCFVIFAKDGADLAIFSGDVFHHPIQLIRPDLPFFADHDKDMAVNTRLSLLEKYSDTTAVFFPAHFSGESAGRVIKTGSKEFKYQYVNS